MPNHNPRLACNNFDLLRLLFAGIVCLVHASSLSGFEQLGWITTTLSSSVAVKSFFIVSGFLIFMSYERSTSIASYASKRIRRIYPAYFAIVMVCSVGLIAVSTKDLGNYFSLEWFKYLAANLSFLNFLRPDLPGVFGSNKLTAVNGALWTLKIEAMFYLSVPLFVFLFRRFSHIWLLILVYGASVAYASVLTGIAERTSSAVYAELARQLPGQLAYFMAGASLFYFLNFFERHVSFFLATAIVVLTVDVTLYPLPLLEPIALGVIVIFFGLFNYLGNFGKHGDFSYGLYIIHFPVIQVLLQVNSFKQNPWSFLFAAVASSLIGAIAMWHLVEKRFLFKSSHYRATGATNKNKAEFTANFGSGS